MSQQRNALKAGVFIVFSLAAIGAILVGIKGLNGLTEPMQTRSVAFKLNDDVGGLRVGDEVRLGGFKVGQVHEITIDTPADQPARILVRFTMPVKYQLRKGASLRIQGTVTDKSWLNFDDLGSGPALADSTVLDGRPSTFGELLATLSQMQQPAKQIVADARDAVAAAKVAIADIHEKTLPTVNQTLDKWGRTAESFKLTGDEATKLVLTVHGQIDGVIKRYNQFVDSAVAMVDKVAVFFGDTTPDFRGTLANLNRITAKFDNSAPTVLSHLEKSMAHIDEITDSIKTAAPDLKIAIADAKDSLAALKSVIAGNRGKIDGTIASIKTTADNLKNASKEVLRAPWRLLYKPQPGEIQNMNLFDAARDFAEAATSLQDAADALRDARAANTDNSAEAQALEKKLAETLKKFQQVEGRLWDELRK